MPALDWPYEGAAAAPRVGFAVPESNLCLDLHGDPQRARVVVFSDGNHHMALEECLREFLAGRPEAGDVFYATTPPRVLVEVLRDGRLRVGNLALTIRPHVFISPPTVLDRLVAEGLMSAHRRLAASRGNVLLVAAGNPKRIAGIGDLARADVRLFISNPRTESVSFDIYAESLRRLAARCGVALPDLHAVSPRVAHGVAVHHREAPKCVADGDADCAVVFRHLALRYTRIFPGHFDVVPLAPEGDPDNIGGTTSIGLIGDGGAFGAAAAGFLLGERARAIYAAHGLVPLSGT
jgi:hypothetical protein